MLVIIIYSHVSYNFAFDLGADELGRSLLSDQWVTPLHVKETQLLTSGRRHVKPQSCGTSRVTIVTKQKPLLQFPTALERCIGFDFKLRDKFINFAATCNEFLLSDFA